MTSILFVCKYRENVCQDGFIILVASKAMQDMFFSPMVGTSLNKD